MDAVTLVETIYGYLGLDPHAGEPDFVMTPAAITGAITRAQQLLAGWIYDAGTGLLKKTATLSVGASVSFVDLPADCEMPIRVVPTGGLPLAWRNEELSGNRRGIGLEGQRLVWDGATAGAETWAIEYQRRAYPARTGPLGTQSGSSSVTLPASDSAGKQSTVTDDYKGRELGFFQWAGTGERGTVTAYNGTTRLATVAVAWGLPPAVGDTYLLVDAWPADWEEARAAQAAMLLRRQDGQWVGMPLDAIVQQAQHASARRRPGNRSIQAVPGA